MKLEEIENQMVEEILSMPERQLLKQKEQEMLNDSKALILIDSFHKAMDDYNFALKSFGENNEITINFQKELYKSKLAMDQYPIIKEYNELLSKCNEPLRYIENNLIRQFKGKKVGKC